jgi:hypothetical protein
MEFFGESAKGPRMRRNLPLADGMDARILGHSRHFDNHSVLAACILRVFCKHRLESISKP